MKLIFTPDDITYGARYAYIFNKVANTQPNYIERKGGNYIVEVGDEITTWREVKSMNGMNWDYSRCIFYGVVDSAFLDLEVDDSFPDRLNDDESPKTWAQYFPVFTLENTQKKLIKLWVTKYKDGHPDGNQITGDELLWLENNGVSVITRLEFEYIKQEYNGDGIIPVLPSVHDDRLKIYRYRPDVPVNRHVNHAIDLGIKHQSDLRIKLVKKLDGLKRGQLTTVRYYDRTSQGLDPVLYLVFKWIRAGMFDSPSDVQAGANSWDDVDWSSVNWSGVNYAQGRSENDGVGDCLYRLSWGYYYKENGQVSAPSFRVKEYPDIDQRVKEKERQRKNIIDDLKKVGVQIGLGFEEFLNRHRVVVDNWIQSGVYDLNLTIPGGSLPLLSKSQVLDIENMNFAWLLNNRPPQVFVTEDLDLLNTDLPEPFNAKVYAAILNEIDV